MRSIDTSTDTASSEAPSTVVAAIGNELNGKEDLGDSSDDEEPPFPFAHRGKVVCPTAGDNLRSNTKGVRSSKKSP